MPKYNDFELDLQETKVSNIIGKFTEKTCNDELSVCLCIDSYPSNCHNIPIER